MQRINKPWRRITAIAIVCVVLDVMFHALLAPTYNYDYPPSFFVQNELFRPAAGIALLIIYILLAVVFCLIQDNLPGSRLSKGIRFGISFGGLWLAGLPGMSIFFGSPLSHELLAGSCDCAALIILGVLLGVFLATNSSRTANEDPKRIVLAVIIISFFFIIGQYTAFIFMNLIPYFRISGAATVIWTLILGLWMGITYCLLRQGVKGNSPVKRSLRFGGVIVGINWLLFNLFVLLIVDMPFLDPLILAGLNIVSVIAGTFVFETLFYKTQAEWSNGMTDTTAAASGTSRMNVDRSVSVHYGTSD